MTAKDEPPKTLSIPEAGKLYFGLSRNGAYAAARRGELPVVKVGSRRHVPVRAMEQLMELPIKKNEAQ